MVETVDSMDHAEILNSTWGLNHQIPLNIMIQVNTSGEPRNPALLHNSIFREEWHQTH